MRVTEYLLSNEDTGLWEKHALGVFVGGTFILAVRTTFRARSRSRHGRVYKVHAHVVSRGIHGWAHVHSLGVSGGMQGLVHVHAWLGRRIIDWVHGCRHGDRWQTMLTL